MNSLYRIITIVCNILFVVVFLELSLTISYIKLIYLIKHYLSSLAPELQIVILEYNNGSTGVKKKFGVMFPKGKLSYAIEDLLGRPCPRDLTPV
jgi:hypothetical protein